MAKWWCTEFQKRSVDHCLQLFGGYGYMLDYPSPGLRRRPNNNDLRWDHRDHEGNHRSRPCIVNIRADMEPFPQFRHWLVISHHERLL